jgi:hypothetical protein
MVQMRSRPARGRVQAQAPHAPPAVRRRWGGRGCNPGKPTADARGLDPVVGEDSPGFGGTVTEVGAIVVAVEAKETAGRSQESQAWLSEACRQMSTGKLNEPPLPEIAKAMHPRAESLWKSLDDLMATRGLVRYRSSAMRDEPIAFVCHGGLIETLLAPLLPIPSRSRMTHFPPARPGWPMHSLHRSGASFIAF